MRRGTVELTWGTIVAMMLAIAVGLTILFIWLNASEDATKKFDEFKSCEGIMGSLGGHKGFCMSTDDCSDKKVDGYYLQRIGKGVAGGCKEAQFCCLAIPNSDNPPSSNVLASASCESLKEGTWGYAILNPEGKKAFCNPLPANGVIDVPADYKTPAGIEAPAQYKNAVPARLVLYYKPKKDVDTLCEVRYKDTIARFVKEENGRYTVPEGNVCWKGIDGDGKVSFYLGDQAQLRSYFGIAEQTVILHMDLKLVTQSTTKDLRLVIGRRA